MSRPGGDDPTGLLVATRAALLDALDALSLHRDAVIVIGAQAVHLHTDTALVALAEMTKDSDLALDPRRLPEDPRVEEAMKRAGFYPDPRSRQPGSWVSPAGIPVDLMVPEALAGAGGKSARGARIPPHDRRAARRARGLEAAVVDNTLMEIAALDRRDTRRYLVRVAGPAALLVAKLHKIAERVEEPHRLNDKDAHDIYRILVSIDTGVLATSFGSLLDDGICLDVTNEAVEQLQQLFAGGPHAQGSVMAGRAEEGIGEPETVALSVSLLADDLIKSITSP